MWRRFSPGLPGSARRLIDPMIRMQGGRPIVGLPQVDKALVIAPHPDDETLGCGGTIALLSRRGATTAVCCVTDGEAVAERWSERAGTARQRRSEARDACRILGVSEQPRFLGRPNEALAEDLDGLTHDLQTVIDEVRPGAVMVPWPLDGHPDHRAVARAVSQSQLSSGVEIWAYEVWTPLWANRLVEIGDVIDVKKAAIDCHRADRNLDPDIALSLNRYRSAAGQTSSTHAEAFLVLSAPRFREMIE